MAINLCVSALYNTNLHVEPWLQGNKNIEVKKIYI